MAATKVRGRPARHASSLLVHQQLRLAGALGALVCAGAVLHHRPGVAGQILAVALLASGGAIIQGARRRIGQLRAGIRSERRVARVLHTSGATAVIHGADLGRGGDADHVVLGPCAAAVETKTGRGRLRRTGTRLQVGRRTLPGDPLTQARRQAENLRRHTGVNTEAVLCIVDLDGPPQHHDGVTVCAARDLVAVLGRLPRVLTASQAEDLATTITLAD